MSGSLVQIVARNIRQLRLKRGWSQEEMAHRCNLHRTYIGAIERGERNITLGTLEEVASAFGLHPSELLKRISNVG